MELILISRAMKRSPQKILLKPTFMTIARKGVANVYESQSRKEQADASRLCEESQRRLKPGDVKLCVSKEV